jgi:hypothetical protein
MKRSQQNCYRDAHDEPPGDKRHRFATPSYYCLLEPGAGIPACVHRIDQDSDPDPSVTLTTVEPTISPTEGTLPGFLEETSTLIIMKNLSVVFVVIFVTTMFYLRWKRKEE